MAQYGWENAPAGIRAPVADLVAALRDLLGENLLGVYLHGSLAMGCFNPDRSDLDLLVVNRETMAPAAKRRLAHRLLAHSGRPHPVEMSALRLQDLHPWQYPTPFDFHYSERWRKAMARELDGTGWHLWPPGTATDPDLAAHITILQHRGVVLWGEPVSAVFPPVPKADYLRAILDDFHSARDGIVQDPVYGVLNLCRVYGYLASGAISSKAEAGRWAASHLQEPYRGVAARALAVYQGLAPVAEIPAEELLAFARYVDDQVARLLKD